MRLHRPLTSWLLMLLLAFMASGAVNAKVASGALDLGVGSLHAERLFNPLTHQGKTDPSYDGLSDSPVVTKGGSIGAMRRLEFQASPKHGTSARNTSKGAASRGPTDGQHALDNSIQVKGASPRRVGVDKANGEIVVFDRTSEGIFHGHVRSFKDLTSQQQNALRNAGLVDKRGNF